MAKAKVIQNKSWQKGAERLQYRGRKQRLYKTEVGKRGAERRKYRWRKPKLTKRASAEQRRRGDNTEGESEDYTKRDSGERRQYRGRLQAIQNGILQGWRNGDSTKGEIRPKTVLTRTRLDNEFGRIPVESSLHLVCHNLNHI